MTTIDMDIDEAKVVSSDLRGFCDEMETSKRNILKKCEDLEQIWQSKSEIEFRDLMINELPNLELKIDGLRRCVDL